MAGREDFSVFEQVRATASRRVRRRLGLPSTSSRAVPLEIAIVAALWLLICPWQPEPQWAVIGFNAAALAAMGAALTDFRRMGSRPLEIGWRILLFAQLLSTLDSATLEPGLPPAAIETLTGALWAVGGVGLIWGLRVDRLRRATDIERLKRAIAERRNAHRRFVDLVDTVDSAVWEATADPLELQFVSRRAGAILGFSPEIWAQQPNLWFERIHQEDRDEVIRVVAEKARKLEAYRLEYRMIANDGRTLWVRDLVNVVEDADGVVKLRGVTVDCTETKQLEHRLRHNANHDALTGLPNRVAFTEALDRAFRNATPGDSFAVLFLDLDRFKIVNDTLGHLAGDTVLEEAAVRIGRAVRSRDVVARLGGDEFAVLAENLHSGDEAIELANRLREELNRPVEVGGRSFALSASIGIKLAGAGSGSARETLRDADTAMYAAKERAPGSQKVFEHRMHDRLMADVETESEIRAGIEDQKVELRYRPIANLADGATFGFEAVLHWPSVSGRVFGPEDYAAIAEQSGLASPLGWSCLHQALATAGCLDEPSPAIAVPLFPALLEQADLLEQLDTEIRETAAQPARLILAVPEEAAAPEEAHEVLHALKERGFRLALTDFGAGRASLSRLCRLPLDFARIVTALPLRKRQTGPDVSLLQAMTRLCRELGIQVIAGGVHTEEQQRLLHRYGCRLGQGPLYGPARTAQQVGRGLASSTVPRIG